MNDLIVKVEGKVLTNNFTEFEKDALVVLSNMSTDLVTDDDFLQATEDVKLCKEIEVRLSNVKQDIVHQAPSVSEIITKIDQLFSKFRETRLKQEKLVKSEKLNRKNEVLKNGEDQISLAAKGSPVEFAFVIDNKAIFDSVKGKGSIEKMIEAVGEVVDLEVERLDSMITLFQTNMREIEIFEKEYPGLFPDKKTIALEQIPTVNAKIEARINKFKLDEQEKKKREEEHKMRLAPLDELKKREEQKQPEVEPIEQKPKISVEPTVETENYLLTIVIHGEKSDAIAVAESVDEALVGFDCVEAVHLNKNQIAA